MDVIAPVEEIIEKSNLTIYTFTGLLGFGTLSAVLMNFYKNPARTDNLILDCANISGERVTTKDIRDLLGFLERNAHKRENCKTALVVNNSLDMTLARVAINLSNDTDYPVNIMNFYAICDALSWMKIAL